MNSFDSSPSNKIYFSIETEIGDVNISEGDLVAFFEHKELPSELNNLKLHASCESPGSIEKRKTIYLKLEKTFNRLYVDASDHIWVLGIEKKILSFFKSKRPPFWFLSTFAVFALLGALTSIILFFLWDIVSNLFSHGINSVNPILSFSVLTLFFLWYTLLKFKNTRIVIQKSKSIWNMNEAKISIILAFLSLLATVIIGIIQIKRA